MPPVPRRIYPTASFSGVHSVRHASICRILLKNRFYYSVMLKNILPRAPEILLFPCGRFSAGNARFFSLSPISLTYSGFHVSDFRNSISRLAEKAFRERVIRFPADCVFCFADSRCQNFYRQNCMNMHSGKTFHRMSAWRVGRLPLQNHGKGGTLRCGVRG